MKIISWNVNGIRAVERKKELDAFLKNHRPDIVCFQEIKGSPDKFSAFLTQNPDYQSFFHPAQKAGYAGTSIWIRRDFSQSLTDVVFETGMPDFIDDEGRIATLRFQKAGKKYSVLGVYFPNGGKSPEAWQGKLIFYKKFLAHINQLRSQGQEVLWGGDINCAHEEIDLARPKDNINSIGFLPEERAWVSQCIAENWVDIFRKSFPEKKDIYSWWHLLTKSRARNVGWRIDYWFCDSQNFPHIKSIEYLSAQMGSDHCPVQIIL